MDEFLGMLVAHGVKLLADIRTVPKSRRFPHFNTDVLAETLPQSGIDYVHLKNLGGLRKPHRDSPNMAWRNDSFRGYADYMGTPEFASAVDELITLGNTRVTAIMCAEAVPWRCHRNLVADALTLLHKIEVRHIMTDKKADPHTPIEFARVQDGHVAYPIW